MRPDFVKLSTALQHIQCLYSTRWPRATYRLPVLCTAKLMPMYYVVTPVHSVQYNAECSKTSPHSGRSTGATGSSTSDRVLSIHQEAVKRCHVNVDHPDWRKPMAYHMGAWFTLGINWLRMDMTRSMLDSLIYLHCSFMAAASLQAYVTVDASLRLSCDVLQPSLFAFSAVVVTNLYIE